MDVNPESDVHLNSHYLDRLLQVAFQRNSIFLITSEWDKRYMIMQFIKEFGYETLMNIKKGGRRTICLLNDSYEIKELKEFLHFFSSYKLGCFTKKCKLDTSCKKAWDQHLKNFHVLLLTPDLFLRALKENFLSLTDVNSLILYECNDEPIKSSLIDIMKEFFDKLEIRKRPRVLGLTLNFIKEDSVENKDDIDEHLRNLENVYHSKITLAKEAFNFLCKNIA